VAQHHEDLNYERVVASLAPAKALAIGIYGESVASYRYRVLSEKLPEGPLQAVFLDMANEEKGHHSLLEALLKKHYPGRDFVLGPEDKELVIVGPRMLEVAGTKSLAPALKMICDSEMLTGRFYAAFHKATRNEEIKPILKEMADECFDHAARLLKLDTLPDQPS